ncbi:MAG: carbon-nitrogen hydrolase family protein [Kiritimatiellia bacterium]
MNADHHPQSYHTGRGGSIAAAEVFGTFRDDSPRGLRYSWGVENFRIALVQSSWPANAPPEDNLELMAGFLKETAGKGASLAAFPEVTLSGCVTRPGEAAERALTLEGEVVEKAVALTRDRPLYSAFGFYELDGADLYNSYVIAGRGRLIGHYRKVHVPPRERGFFTPGPGFKVFELPFARVGLSICYDNEIPESHICLALKGAELILMPAGWADHWEREDYVERCSTDEEVVEERRRWMRMMFGARCRDTGTYSALVNHSGPEGEGPWKFAGKSMVFAPTGKVLAEARAWDEEIIYADLSARLLENYRSMDAFALRGRRPEAYGPLVEGSSGGCRGERG